MLMIVYSTQKNLKIRVRYSVHTRKKIIFTCLYPNCNFYVNAFYSNPTEYINTTYQQHNHTITHKAKNCIISVINTELLMLIKSIIKNTSANSSEIIKIIKEKYSITSTVEKEIMKNIKNIHHEYREEINGLYAFYSQVKAKYKYFEDENTFLVILDEARLHKYSTILADGTFGVFLNSKQLYTIYVQVSPSLLLLVSFAICSYKNKQTYLFIYTHINENHNIHYVIHDNESGVVSVLKEFELSLIFCM